MTTHPHPERGKKRNSTCTLFAHLQLCAALLRCRSSRGRPVQGLAVRACGRRMQKVGLLVEGGTGGLT